jgi:hypothetical protein
LVPPGTTEQASTSWEEKVEWNSRANKMLPSLALSYAAHWSYGFVFKLRTGALKKKKKACSRRKSCMHTGSPYWTGKPPGTYFLRRGGLELFGEQAGEVKVCDVAQYSWPAVRTLSFNVCV